MQVADMAGKQSLEEAEKLIEKGRFADAEAICRQALQHNEGQLEAYFLLGLAAYHQGHWDEAVSSFRLAITYAPEVSFLHRNLAVALIEAGRYEQAEAALEETVRLDGLTAGFHYHQGLILQRRQLFQEALQAYEKALALDPAHLLSYINRSAVLLELDDNQGAVACCLQGLKHVPDSQALVGNLATAYGKMFRFEESLAAYQRLLELVSTGERAEVLGRTANILCGAWRIEESIACFEQAVRAAEDPDQRRALASTRLFVLHYSPTMTPEEIAAAHREWGTTYFGSAPARTFANERNPERRLRIGYISPDLRIHAVVFFLQPVLAAHDLNRFDIYCYSDVKKPDAVTRQIREQHGVIWRDTSCCSDDETQRMIGEDRIDVLVDLAGHSSSHRLSLFARRVAPVQVSWIGYPNTTGLAAMDYRITDAKADPPEMTEGFHTEELVRMPDAFLCYRPGGDFPPENPLPLLSNRVVTFGSFSNFAKVTKEMLEAWARIMAAVPGSRLVFRARGMTPERSRQDILPIFAAQGVQEERITILGHARSVTENLQDYHRIDVALDTFPYHGTTTTCESLYMGVPVVTLAGRSHVSRVGVSLLQNVGLPELIAQDPEEYVATAVALAGDLPRLLQLRKSLRSMLLSSPLTDNVRFAGNLESAYRLMWRRWCQESR